MTVPPAAPIDPIAHFVSKVHVVNAAFLVFTSATESVEPVSFDDDSAHAASPTMAVMANAAKRMRRPFFLVPMFMDSTLPQCPNGTDSPVGVGLLTLLTMSSRPLARHKECQRRG